MNKDELFDKALQIAIRAHERQKDKSGHDYIMHPIRVSERCKNIDAKIVALLHDTIEDTDVTPDYLIAEGFPEEVIDIILLVTRKENETYQQFIERAAKNPVSREVKIADLEDNMDIRRLSYISDESAERLRKYLKAWHYLQKQ